MIIACFLTTLADLDGFMLSLSFFLRTSADLASSKSASEEDTLGDLKPN